MDSGANSGLRLSIQVRLDVLLAIPDERADLDELRSSAERAPVVEGPGADLEVDRGLACREELAQAVACGHSCVPLSVDAEASEVVSFA